MTTRRLWAAAVTLAALALAGCGGAADLGADAASSSPASGSVSGAGETPGKSAGRSSDMGSGGAGTLADEAEKIAEGESTAPLPARNGPVLGADMSWPQCPKGMGIPERRSEGMPMPLPQAEYVIVGLTNGPAFTPNPCLADQVAWMKERQLMAAAYAVTSYPDRPMLEKHGDTGPYDGATRLGALRNVGYQQAKYNLGVLRDAGLETPVVWIDVEPVPEPFGWSSDPTANAAVVEGVARGYREAGYRTGVYSNVGLWAQVVGDLSLGLPEWRATGDEGRAGALAGCAADKSFQGGQAVLGQWLEDSRDHNLTCPGIGADLGRWFHQY